MKTHYFDAISTILQKSENSKVKLTVTGQSMYPTLCDGQLIEVDCFSGDASQINIGDIIVYKAYKSNKDKQHYIIHRVVHLFSILKHYFFITKGDNNSRCDRYIIPSADIIAIIKNSKNLHIL